jgi:cytochrome P450
MLRARTTARRRARMRGGYPKLAGALPVIGHMHAIHNDFLGMVRRGEQDLGPMFWVNLGFDKQTLMLMQPESFALFKHKAMTSAHIGDVKPLRELFGKSIIAQDGAAHHHARSAMTSAFTPKGVSASELGSAFADIIEKQVASWPERRGFRVLAEMRELVLSLMFRMLGVPEAEMRPWRENYEELMLLALNVPIDLPGSPRRRGRRARDWLNERLMGFIAEARKNPHQPGLLAMLANGRDEAGEPLSDEELVDNLRLLVLAGHETSASTLSWMMAMLAEHPYAWDALCLEAHAAGRAPRSPKEVRSFPVAEAIFRETLRLYPPVHVDSRRCGQDIEFDGHVISAGTDVSIPIVHLSRLSSMYEDPDTFRMERWLGRNEALSPLEMAQFGGGPHFCLGYHVAWMEIVQVAVTAALVLDAKGLRPHLPDGVPAMRYLPLCHPSSKAGVVFVEEPARSPKITVPSSPPPAEEDGSIDAAQ